MNTDHVDINYFFGLPESCRKSGINVEIYELTYIILNYYVAFYLRDDIIYYFRLISSLIGKVLLQSCAHDKQTRQIRTVSQFVEKPDNFSSISIFLASCRLH